YPDEPALPADVESRSGGSAGIDPGQCRAGSPIPFHGVERPEERVVCVQKTTVRYRLRPRQATAASAEGDGNFSSKTGDEGPIARTRARAEPEHHGATGTLRSRVRREAQVGDAGGGSVCVHGSFVSGRICRLQAGGLHGHVPRASVAAHSAPDVEAG